jgi:hypothetical protein
MGVFAGHEEGVIVEPGAGVCAELVEGGAIGVRGIGEEVFGGATESRHFEFDYGAVVDGAVRKFRGSG